mgnify:CR=1 FL=1
MVVSRVWGGGSGRASAAQGVVGVKRFAGCRSRGAVKNSDKPCRDFLHFGFAPEMTGLNGLLKKLSIINNKLSINMQDWASPRPAFAALQTRATNPLACQDFLQF